LGSLSDVLLWSLKVSITLSTKSCRLLAVPSLVLFACTIVPNVASHIVYWVEPCCIRTGMKLVPSVAIITLKNALSILPLFEFKGCCKKANRASLK